MHGHMRMGSHGQHLVLTGPQLLKPCENSAFVRRYMLAQLGKRVQELRENDDCSGWLDKILHCGDDVTGVELVMDDYN